MFKATRATAFLVGSLGVAALSLSAGAQIRHQPSQPAQATPAPTPPPRRLAPPPPSAFRPPVRVGYAAEPYHQAPYYQYRQQQRYLPPVVYYPVYGYAYVPSGCGASVCDVNGNPVLRGFDDPMAAQGMSPAMVPDLSGSPYVALDGGVIFVDFGNGDRRNVPACAQQASESTPDGQPRTIFYSAQADGLILRPGSRGRIVGTPPAGAAICYGLDQYGRVALAY